MNIRAGKPFVQGRREPCASAIFVSVWRASAAAKNAGRLTAKLGAFFSPAFPLLRNRQQVFNWASDAP
jgi:hypothetical protein